VSGLSWLYLPRSKFLRQKKALRVLFVMFVDLRPSTLDSHHKMKHKTVKREKPAKDYPAVTHGSRVAARGRQKANRMSDAQREEYFRRGMVLIYGSGLPKKAVAGH